MSQFTITSQDYQFILLAQKLATIYAKENKEFKALLKSEKDYRVLAGKLLGLAKTNQHNIHYRDGLRLRTMARFFITSLDVCFMLIFGTL